MIFFYFIILTNLFGKKLNALKILNDEFNKLEITINFHEIHIEC